MKEMRGVVTIVQESRFQLTDDTGVSHLFLLSSHAMSEPEQLASLSRTQARVRVRYVQPDGIIGMLAKRVDLLDGEDGLIPGHAS